MPKRSRLVATWIASALFALVAVAVFTAGVADFAGSDLGLGFLPQLIGVALLAAAGWMMKPTILFRLRRRKYRWALIAENA